MKPGDNGYAYHGFDSGSRNVNIYHGDLDIRDIVFNFPELSLTIENMVTAHALPAADTIKIFTLEISFQDSNGSEVYNIIETFGKRFTLMPLIGVVPHKQIENTQLQSDEVRTLNFTLPITVEDKINVVLIELKLYEVADEHQGDLTKAHRISDPIIVEQIELIP
jgi:hypothetical protein